MKFSLVAAGAANRRVHIAIDDGTNEVYLIQIAVNITDGVTAVCTYSGIGFHQTSQASAYGGMLPSEPLELPEGWRIRTETSGLQAGDNYSAPQMFIQEKLKI